MAFTPRTFEEILIDMIAYVKARTSITDFSVGSVVRTLLEAAALEDDEQYFQMVQLLDAFSYTTASGENLDNRLADFNIARQQAKPSFGQVRFTNSNLVFDQVSQDNVSGQSTVKIFNTTGFPISGFPYTIRIAEGTVRIQDKEVTNLDTSTNEFTLSSTLDSDIKVGDRVSLVTNASSHLINAGTNILAPATNSEKAKIYQTQEPAFIEAGNFYSNEVIAKSAQSGATTNTAVGRVTRFSGAPTFSGAGVTNTTPMEGGRDRESDQDLRARAFDKIQSLSRGTPLAIRSSSVGVTDPATGQRVISANLVESFDEDEVIVYVDDGTGLEPDSQALAQSSLANSASAGDDSLTLNDGASFPSSGFVFIAGDNTELVEYEVKPAANVLKLASSLVNSHDAGDIVRFIDYVTESAETGQRRFSLQNFPVVRSTFKVFIKQPSASSWTSLSTSSDVILNKGTGEFIVVDKGGLVKGTKVVAHYNYYTNLISRTQRVLEGDPDNSLTFPGVKAAGVFVSVEAPIIKRITVRASIAAENSFTETELGPSVKRELESYINSLKIGDDVIKSKLIDAAHNVQGVKDVVLTLPTSNVVVLENELPVPFDANDNSLVTVT